jgi:predicted dinucleotide-binding enzyme
MHIGILGTGGIAEALGTQWVRAGHEVSIAGRDPERARRLATAIGALSSGPLQNAGTADVLLLALPADAIPDVLAQLGPLPGRVLIDPSNWFEPGTTIPAAPAGTSMAGRIATLVPDAHVVKAFHLSHVDIWRMTPPVFAGRPLHVPLLGNDPTAVSTVATLVRDLGAVPIDAGGLDRAWMFEATAAAAIGLWFAGHDAQAVLPPLPSPEPVRD